MVAQLTAGAGHGRSADGRSGGSRPGGPDDSAEAEVPSPPPRLRRSSVADNTLPDTASSLPLIALCGLLALGGAFTGSSIRKRAL